jgi:hypothetical protein
MPVNSDRYNDRGNPMSNVQTLWDVQALTTEAIERVEEHANDRWIAEVRDVVRLLASCRHEFTTDDVWLQVDRLDVTTHEPRAMGAVMRFAARSGWVTATDRVVSSLRPECHCRPVRVWQSLLKGTQL